MAIPTQLPAYTAHKPMMFPFFYSREYHGYMMETSWEYHGDIWLVGGSLTRYLEALKPINPFLKLAGAFRACRRK
jgi:hypothetical protein